MVSVLSRTNIRSRPAIASTPARAVIPTQGSINVKAMMLPTGATRPTPTMTAVTPTWPASLALRVTRVTRSPVSKRRVAAGPIATRWRTSVIRSQAVHRALLCPVAMSPMTFPATMVAISATQASRVQVMWPPPGSASRARPSAVGSRMSAPAQASVASTRAQVHHPPRRPVESSKRLACLHGPADTPAGSLFTRPPHCRNGLSRHWVF